VGDRYSFTSDGLHNIEVYGVAPGEVWEALHSNLITNGVDAELPAPDTATPMISRSLRIPLDLARDQRACENWR